jgi:hypothetical protein
MNDEISEIEATLSRLEKLMTKLEASEVHV